MINTSLNNLFYVYSIPISDSGKVEVKITVKSTPFDLKVGKFKCKQKPNYGKIRNE